MRDSLTRRRALQAATSCALAGSAGCISGGRAYRGRAATVQVRVENVAPTDFYPSDAATGGGVWLTPGVYAIQEGYTQRVPEGESASVGLEALAEAGQPTGFEGQQGFIDELTNDGAVVLSETITANDTVADPNDPTGEVPGTPAIAPGGAFEFDVRAEFNEQFLFVSMVVPSNDIVVAPAEWITLWPADRTPIEGDITDRFALWDVGTEPNGRPGFGPDQPPVQDTPDQGADEDGVVRRLSEVDDGYDYPAVEEIMKLTLRPQ